MGEGSEERRGGGEDRDVYRSDDFSHRTISTGAPARIPDRDCFYTCLSPSRENYDSDRASRFITSNQPAIKVTLRQEGEITRDNRKRSVSDQSIIGTSGHRDSSGTRGRRVAGASLATRGATERESEDRVRPASPYVYERQIPKTERRKETGRSSVG